jgi:hypothetical protein
MANTTNFNWETPDDTDLVKDGAAAMRTLGNSIDTSFVDLKGGTTGQILSKASNTDLDYTWVTTDDANAIQNAIVDAKGDLIAASAADTPARLAVGNNGETLVADSSTSTGLKWAKSANFVGCILWKSAAQSVANATGTAITFDSEFIDTDGFHSTSTNTSRVTIPTGFDGKYQINGTCVWSANGAGIRFLNFYKNGGLVSQSQGILPNGTFDQPLTGSFIWTGVAGDYFEVYGYQTSGGNLNAIGNGTFGASQFSVQYLGA